MLYGGNPWPPRVGDRVRVTAVGIVATVTSIKGSGDGQLFALDLYPSDALGPPRQGLSARRDYRLDELEPAYP
jgi:hypothetical protein